MACCQAPAGPHCEPQMTWEASQDQPNHGQQHRPLSVKINIVVSSHWILSWYTSLLWWKLTNIPSYWENGPFLVCPYWKWAPEKSLTPWLDRRLVGTWHQCSHGENHRSAQFSQSLYLKAGQLSSQNHCPWATWCPATCLCPGWPKKKEMRRKEKVLWLTPSPTSCSLLLK